MSCLSRAKTSWTSPSNSVSFCSDSSRQTGHSRTTRPRPNPRAIAEAAPAMTLCAIARAHAARPGKAKLECLRKGLAHQQGLWQKQKQPGAAPWLVLSATEAYVATKDKLHADLAFEIADWICGLQMASDPRTPHWQGGFARWQDGKIASVPPTVESAAYAEALSRACRAAASRRRPAPGALPGGLGALLAIPDDTSIHVRQHPSLRRGIQAAALRRVSRFAPGRDGADRLRPDGCLRFMDYLESVAELGGNEGQKRAKWTRLDRGGPPAPA